MLAKIDEDVYYVLNRLNQFNYEAYLVGGCVRDFLLNKNPTDYDITTNALPSQIKEVFSANKTIDIGIAHGTIGVIINNQKIEVTTYRIDGDYLDSRHPSNVTFSTSLKDDLSRRDFTMNALAYTKDDKIIDYFNGITDINNKIVRAVNDPYIRFNEDALRILRCLRFASTLHFKIEENTSKAIFSNYFLLQNISKERINVEINKLLLGKNVEKVLVQYYEVFTFIIEELKQISRDKYHVNAKMIKTAKNSLLYRITLLLKDIPNNQVINILKRLKYEINFIKDAKLLNQYFYHEFINDRIALKMVLNKIGYRLLMDLLKIKMIEAKVINQDLVIKYKMIINTIDLIENSKECYQLKDLQIDGNDLEAIGIKGVEVGKTLKTLLNLVIEEKIINEKTSLITYIINNRVEYHD